MFIVSFLLSSELYNSSMICTNRVYNLSIFKRKYN